MPAPSSASCGRRRRDARRWPRWSAASCPSGAYEQVIGRLLGLDDHGLLARALADLSPRPEVAELVRRARAGGVRVAVLSNSWGTGDYDPYDGYQLDELFDAVVISDQVGLRKPSPAIYELTASKIGLPPDECLFVDDTKDNLPVARELGMGTLLFTGRRQRDRRDRKAHRHRLTTAQLGD
jgi:putative hydrolase of the HAD superfamily